MLFRRRNARSLRKAVVNRFLQEDYAVKKHNHARDYTIDICMYLCPITFQTMHRPVSHMHVFLDALDNNTKHGYYTVPEILEGTVERIKEMMHTTYNNRKDRVNKDKVMLELHWHEWRRGCR